MSTKYVELHFLFTTPIPRLVCPTTTSTVYLAFLPKYAGQGPRLKLQDCACRKCLILTCLCVLPAPAPTPRARFSSIPKTIFSSSLVLLCRPNLFQTDDRLLHTMPSLELAIGTGCVCREPQAPQYKLSRASQVQSTLHKHAATLGQKDKRYDWIGGKEWKKRATTKKRVANQKQGRHTDIPPDRLAR